MARDSSGRVHTGCFVAWDASSAYYLLGGADPELRNSGAGSLALWRAIQHVANLATSEQQVASSEPSSHLPTSDLRDPSAPLTAHGSRSFDFEGSMVEGIERFVRAWGGHQTPYHVIWKHPSNLLRAYRAIVHSGKSLAAIFRK